ncbi:hypothetical protein Taro_054251 [Colocasia esculenta]|uniref:Uncharacterized protein n=1 Tax=Colocasia esculenta TaxID=4460 RepID=A0A843XPH6_COLES|nr:hypothetical protein [Colocasia esculenta]
MVVIEKSQSNAQNAKIMGSGERTLVLSHGYGADQSIWDDVAHDLAQSFRVVLFDWNFSGAVDASLIHDASEYSLYEAFSDDLHCIDGYEGGFERSDVESIFTNMESNFTMWARGFAGIVVAQGGCPSAAEKFGECLVRMRPEVALAVAKAVFLSDLREMLDQVEVPCTVINGEKDPVVPVSVSRYMERKIRGGATLDLLEFDGHFPQLTASKILVDALINSVLGSSTSLINDE